MPATTHKDFPPVPRRLPQSLWLAAAVCVAGCTTNANITMPEVRGKSCAHYAAMIAELTGTVERKELEAQAETAGFFAASVALSLVVPFAGLATIPAEQEAKRDTYQAQSDLWSWRVAYEAKECSPSLAVAGSAQGEN